MKNTNKQGSVDSAQHSDPIPISQARSRARSVSSASSGSASSAYDLPTPISGSLNSMRTSIPSPTSSPIFSYFLPSPTKMNGTATFPLRRKFGGPSPVFEEDEEGEKEIPAAAHMRRASAQMATRFLEPKANPLPDPTVERGTSLLRRLSLTSAPFAKNDFTKTASPPSPPPNTAVRSSPPNPPFINKPRRSATISTGEGRPRRAPSPMGERILKGHFDGF